MVSLSPSVSKVYDNRLSDRTVVLVGDICRCQRLEFFLRVTEHFLQGRVGRDNSLVVVFDGDTDRGVFKQPAPTFLIRSQSFFGFLPITVFLRQVGIES